MLRDLIYFLLGIEPPAEEKKPEYFYTPEERRRIAEAAPHLDIYNFRNYAGTYAAWEYAPDGSRKLGKRYSDQDGMRGAKGCCLRDWIEQNPYLMTAIKKQLNSFSFLGLVFLEPNTRKLHTYYQPGDIVQLDGHDAFFRLIRILEALGFTLVLVREYADTEYYELRSL